MSDAWGAADPLGEALHRFRLSGVFYCRSEFTAPWGLDLPAFPSCMMFHVAVTGQCWLTVDGAEPRVLRPGGLALVPHGTGHRLRGDDPAPAIKLFDAPRELISDRYEVLRLGGGGTPTTVMCGVVRFDDPSAQLLPPLLPPLITVDAWSAPELDWIQSALRFMALEARELRPGGDTVITRLADILVIQILRAWIASDPAAQTGWLGALRDRQIGRAMAVVHRDPGHRWTLTSLAEVAGLSRSAFAARFTTLVGEPAMHYVTRWRMHAAHFWLQGSDATLSHIATRLGYESDAAFSRAFRRYIGLSPGMVKRQPSSLGWAASDRSSARAFACSPSSAT